jgi:hypothetical protein
MARSTLQTSFLRSLWALSQFAGQQQMPALFSAIRSSHSHAGLPLERLQQAVTPQVCAELSARVSKAITCAASPLLCTVVVCLY